MPALSPAILGAAYAEDRGHFWPFALVTAIAGRAPGLGQIILPGEVVIDVFGQTVNTAQPPVPPEPPTQSELVLDWLMARLREFLPMLIVGLIGYWFLRDRLERSVVPIKTHPLITLGYGLVGLVLVVAVITALLLDLLERRLAILVHRLPANGARLQPADGVLQLRHQGHHQLRADRLRR